ncbi:LiaF transmembrane domain-containing protein [Lentzea sp. NEAU-D7]|uniref:LiaF transmembrane domain-containing protein n=1 Tax=Lentzea sp. NEAU-D7 TaxID=2994667 RepID=UPI00224AC9F5|nr:LiaF domain-containing protein [Lentzea sp. NEAU-D7]MCX2951447.1 LiaF-related protein [Lentzea sp. NEAU-D7]
MRPVRVWMGLVLVALGVFGILDATDVLDSGDAVGRWWPVALVGLGLVAMAAQRRVSLGSVVITLAGLVLLTGTLGWATGDLLWPTVLACAGIAVLVGLRRHHGTRTPVAILSGTTTRERTQHLRHADVSAIFGGATLDLREAHVDGEASIDAFALFGGVEVLVPEGWRVSVGGLPFMGGIVDKTDNDRLRDDAPVLTVNGTALFGAVEVANHPKP